MPDAIFVGRVLFGPSRAGDGAIELGEESTTGSWRDKVRWHHPPRVSTLGRSLSPRLDTSQGEMRVCGSHNLGSWDSIWRPLEVSSKFKSWRAAYMVISTTSSGKWARKLLGGGTKGPGECVYVAVLGDTERGVQRQ